jgi:hypothetical protein
MGGDGEGVAGVVVDEGEDLDVRAAGQAPVGEVGRPGLVRQRGLEADVGGLGSLLGLGLDEPGGVEVPPDRGDGDGAVVVGLEVPADRVGARVEARRGELAAKADDQLDGVGVQPGR